ncbi:MAG: EAL domain-containing protein [Candidatus Izemoplasmatales bacterium]
MRNWLSNFFLQVKETVKHFGWFTLILIPILFIVNWSFLTTMSAQRETIITNEMAQANQEMDMIDFYISRSVISTYNDLNVIRDAEEANVFLNDPNETNLDGFEQLVYRIATNKPEFSHISLADSNGDELLKVSRLNEELIIEDEFFLSNISDQPYFMNASSVDEETIYIEPLYSEGGNPILTMVLPMVLDDMIEYYIILDYDANHFLSVFEHYLDEPERHYTIGLINLGNVWGVDERTKRFYTLTDPNRVQEVLSQIESSEYAQLTSFEVNEDLLDHTNIEEGFFQVYSIADIDQAIEDSNFLFLKNPWLLVIFNALVALFFIYMGYFIKSKNDERILLNANMYLSDKNKDGVMITNEDKEIQYVNETFENAFGYRLEEIKDKKPKNAIGIPGTELNFKHITKDSFYENNIWNKTRDGIRILKYLRVRHELTARGKIKHFLGIYSEPEIELDDYIKYTKDKEKVIESLAAVFKNHQFIINQTVLMMIHLEHASTYDFTLFLKKNLDARYVLCIPKANFLMIYANIERYQFNHVIDLFDQLIETYRHLPHVEQAFSHQFVVAMADEKTGNIKDLIDSLLITLEVSKYRRQLKHLIYSHEMRSIIEREKDIIEELESGFSIDEFYLNYQVQKDLINDDYIGVEALLRWKNKNLGQIPPNEFIPIIENSFYINQLTIMVVRKVIEDFKPYVNDLPKDFRISINLTNFDFGNDYIMDNILHIIEESLIPSKYFTFEITESNYLENVDKTNRIIEKLHKKDINVAIDDFGTGFSSINSLKSIEVDEVKIDKTFIEKYPEQDNGDMFRIIAYLIKSLDKKIVVEGTETEEHIEFAKLNQCHVAQGYYISKPKPINEFVKVYLHNTKVGNGE